MDLAEAISPMGVRAGSRGAVAMPSAATSGVDAVLAWARRARAGLLHFAMWFGGVGRRSAASRRTAADDPRAWRFESEILPHLDAAYDLARYLCRDADAAEDVVQEACLRAFRALDGRTGASPRAWLLAIVRNCHLDWRDRRRRSPDAPIGAGPDDADPLAAIAADGDPEDDLLRRGEAEAVRRLLHALPEAMREILVLRDIEDCSYREIAEVLDVPIGTVMSRLARARKAFAALWTKRDDRGDQR